VQTPGGGAHSRAAGGRVQLLMLHGLAINICYAFILPHAVIMCLVTRHTG